MEDFSFFPAWKLNQMIMSKEISPVEMMTSCFTKIEELDPQFNMFISLINKDDAISRAKALEEKILRNEYSGYLCGIPLPVKDLTPTTDIRTTYGSLINNDFIPFEDLLHISKLKKAGMIVIGKTNTSEFGHSAITENRLLDPCRNPWNSFFGSGGSSGGSAVSVAAGIVPISAWHAARQRRSPAIIS